MILNTVHVHRAVVDFDLLDAGNVVYHPNYLILCERARSAALSAAGYSFQELWADGVALAVLQCNAKFFRALELAQDLAIVTRTTDATGTRLSVTQEIVLAKTLNPEFPEYKEAGFKKTAPSIEKKDLLFQVDFLLGSVKLNPLKATRHPERLVQALALESGRNKDTQI